MFEQFLAVLVRIAVALESLASAGGLTSTAAPATNTTTETTTKPETKTDAPKTGRGRARAGAADNAGAAGAGDAGTSDAGAAGAAAGGRGRRSRSTTETKTVEETAEIKTAREAIQTIGIAFAEYPDLTAWVQDYLKGKGWENITQIPAAQVLDVFADFQEKEAAEFSA